MILARKMLKNENHHVYWETLYSLFLKHLLLIFMCQTIWRPAAAVTNITRQSEKGREEKEGKRVWVWLRNAFLQIGFSGVEGWGVMHCYCAEYFSLLRRGNVRICIKNPNDLTYSQQVFPEIRHASVSRIHNNIWGSMEKNKRQFSKKRGKTEEWIFLAPPPISYIWYVDQKIRLSVDYYYYYFWTLFFFFSFLLLCQRAALNFSILGGGAAAAIKKAFQFVILWETVVRKGDEKRKVGGISNNAFPEKEHFLVLYSIWSSDFLIPSFSYRYSNTIIARNKREREICTFRQKKIVGIYWPFPSHSFFFLFVISSTGISEALEGGNQSVTHKLKNFLFENPFISHINTERKKARRLNFKFSPL